ncbi:ATP-binding protein [Devosia sp. MC521]|uniref:ATP-binding protein n=1 Tax=Devosia sp. MC521 TaxID=2759954 RepID=UPI0015F92D93|nr:ATP-binding protein [Devosia sp. MC521]MBJ6987085.1 ATP-binding protein [Devosia sp. MC521]QMW62706.1 ATP-binding protein [Devosia sp. MC521]
MKLNFEGRLSNMRLPDGATALVYSVFEGVMNGIQAIEERFTVHEAANKGKILVEIHKENKRLSAIKIGDNGIGLSDAHLEAFNECDTRSKAAIGGRGVGRLVWHKAFDRVAVQSTTDSLLGSLKVSFDFRPEMEESRSDLKVDEVQATESGTAITLSGPLDPDLTLASASLTRSLCLHFFPFFLAGSMPNLVVVEGKRQIDVGEYVSERMSVELSEELDLKGQIGVLRISHVYADPKIARKLVNSILLTAQGRVVDAIEIEKKFALRQLSNHRAYVCVVEGAFLNDKVDQERTSFKARPEELERIREAVIDAAEKFLAAHIDQIRQTQKRFVISLLEEHPQLAVSVTDVDGYVKSLSPGMNDEDIGKTLFTLLYRRERKLKAEINHLGSQPEDLPEQVDANVARLLHQVNEGAKLRLAEYTIKRHQVIQIAKSLLKSLDDSSRKYALEKTVHDLICPMGTILSSKEYASHNLWLVDELLSCYQFFASDKTLSSISDSSSTKEPDLVFLNPFGFRREGTNDPVVIVEFKRPGDEKTSSDPIDQVLTYVERLRSRTVRDVEGQVVDEIGEHTPFECIVVCDLTEGTRAKLRRSIVQTPTPDGLGFYGYSPIHRASIRVLSYRKMFRDAEARNMNFFRNLGLLPEEVEAALKVTMQSGGALTADALGSDEVVAAE